MALGARPYVLLLLQSTCTSMCRHMYDWNIVNCDVKQQIYLTLPYVYWYIFNSSSVPFECPYRPGRTWSESTYTGICLLTHLSPLSAHAVKGVQEARVRILVYVYLLICPHWVPMPSRAYMKREYVYWYMFTYSSVPIECPCRPGRTESESTYTGICLLTHLSPLSAHAVKGVEEARVGGVLVVVTPRVPLRHGQPTIVSSTAAVRSTDEERPTIVSAIFSDYTD